MTTGALAHEDPAGCFRSGPAIVISVYRADGTTGLVGGMSECETINYRAVLKKAVASDDVCAFSGGTFSLTTPDGVVHDIEMDVPCIGGTTAPCDPTVVSVQSPLIPYTVNKADVTPDDVSRLEERLVAEPDAITRVLVVHKGHRGQDEPEKNEHRHRAQPVPRKALWRDDLFRGEAQDTGGDSP
jgi:hypothetical protein